MRRARAAVLVSGGGTNLQAMIDAAKRGELPSAELALVVSSNPEAYALTRASMAGIKCEAIDYKACASHAEFEEKLASALREEKIDVVVLAGFMKILTGKFTTHYENRMINVHPALIPSFCGKGYYGLKVHEAALSRGVKLTGATVHIVNAEPDGGRILLQKAVEVRENDTPETLQRRVMEEAEWQILPKALELISSEFIGGNV